MRIKLKNVSNKAKNFKGEFMQPNQVSGSMKMEVDEYKKLDKDFVPISVQMSKEEQEILNPQIPDEEKPKPKIKGKNKNTEENL